jgi:signal transduction histidine kinase
VSAQRDPRSLRARLWASRWPEAAWLLFAAGNLAWMILVPSWSSLPFHFTWMSLLLLYGLGVRTWTRALTWTLLLPVMTATGLLFVDARIRGLQPYDEVIELPMMIVMLSLMMRLTGRRKADMARLDKLSRYNMALLDRQRAFVQNASHELRTPITVALAHAELLPRPGTDPAAAEDLDIITDELTRLRRLTDRLLLLATAEQPDRLHLAPTRLTDILDDALRRWEPVPRKWVAGHHDDTAVLADPDRLVVALDAILDNAVRFTREGGRIELSVHRDGQRAGITVADSGPGIPDSQLGSVFDRFNTASPNRDTARNFGLGLSIVRAIAEAHGGQVTASPGPFGGAAVTLWLPQHDLLLSPALPAEHAER